MSFVKCAMCPEIKGVSEMYYCTHCEIWMCSKHPRFTLSGEPQCPRCGKKLARRR